MALHVHVNVNANIHQTRQQHQIQKLLFRACQMVGAQVFMKNATIFQEYLPNPVETASSNYLCNTTST